MHDPRFEQDTKGWGLPRPGFDTRSSTPWLAFGAGVLLLGILAVQALQKPDLGWALVCVLAMLLAFVVRGVNAPRWARLGGYTCALMGGLAAAWLLLGVAPLGGALLLSLSLVPGAIWMIGASLLDDGVGRALGIAGGIGVIGSAILDLARYFLLASPWQLGRVLSLMTMLLALVWFAALGRDLIRGDRHSLDSMA